ncbi:MAG: S8 family serine peptidase, partial [Chitinophagaceae bacterium]
SVLFHKRGSIYHLSMKKALLTQLLATGKVLFADVFVPPQVELTTGSIDMATNAANLAQAVFPNITGRGITVSIKENKPDTADIDYRSRFKTTGTSSLLVTSHASIMATTIGGAGNSSPFAKGVAQESFLSSANFLSLLPETDSFYRRYNISVQNHSYGTTIQNYYGAEAYAYDISSHSNPHLLHVFSAGNSGGNDTGTYAGFFGNLTGNFKMAKNIITVGAIDSFYKVAPLSSRGPTYDGRIKPEIVAFGADGSSGAAAMVSGAAALIQQAYKNRHQDSLPPAHLVKAVLINSARDVHLPGPDFASGYGSLQVHDAVLTLAEGRAQPHIISANEEKSVRLWIPGNTARFKLTLCWPDLPAMPNAPKALINDLSGLLKRGSEVWHPWILRKERLSDSLQLPAYRGVDTLNNTEQITLENPASGWYDFVLSAKNITGSQAYTVAYQSEGSDSLLWTFPTTSDVLEGGKANVLRWQTARKGPGTLQYATGSGTWTDLAQVNEVSAGYYVWSTPDTFSTVQLRMRFTGKEFTSAAFVISRPPQLQTGFVCKDSFLLYWNKLPVMQYELYGLGIDKMESLGRLNDTFSLQKKLAAPYQYFSVAPIVSGKPGMRSDALNLDGSGVDCYFKAFFLQTQTVQSATFYASVGTSYNIKNIRFQKFVQGKYINRALIPTPPGTDFVFTDSALVSGSNLYRLEIFLQSGALLHSETVTLYHFGSNSLVIYPNPVAVGQKINFATSEAGRVTIEIFTAAGARVHQFSLPTLLQQLAHPYLAKGIYFVHYVRKGMPPLVQKLVVY